MLSEADESLIEVEFTFIRLMGIIIFLCIAGAILTMYQIGNNEIMTPETAYSQIWSILISYILTICLIFGFTRLVENKQIKSVKR